METGKWHREEIKIAWYRLINQINRYGKYVTQNLTRRLKRPKVDPEFIEKLEYWRQNRGLTVVTNDTVDAFRSMADGKYYTSKKAYRNELRAQGFDEVGNDRGEESEKSRKYWEDKKQTEEIQRDVAEAIRGR